MLYHSELLILELIKLYTDSMGLTNIPLDLLENAFYALQDVMNNERETGSYKVFIEELDKLINLSSDISYDHENVYIDSDISIIKDEVLEQLELLPYDDLLSYYSFNYSIIKALNLETNPEEFKSILTKNQELMKMFLRLAEEEYLNQPNTATLEEYNEIFEELINIFNNLESSDLTKLKVACTFFNDYLMTESDEEFDNTAWHIALFSADPNQILILAYDRIDYWCYECEKEEKEPLITDINIFLIELFKNLIHYLDSYPNTLGKEALTIKKYLLLSLPELDDIRDDYLKNKEINTIAYVNEDMSEFLFENLFNVTLSCLNDLFVPDHKISHEYKFSKAIISALFIKTFLNLSFNQKSIDKLINALTSNPYYKKGNYTIASTIIDDIILSPTNNRTLN